MTITFICNEHHKPFAECGCPAYIPLTNRANTTHVWDQTLQLDYSGIDATPVYRADQHTLDAIRAIVREEIVKALAEQEDGTPHIVQVRQDFEAGGTCEYVDWDGKRYKGVLFPVDEKED